MTSFKIAPIVIIGLFFILAAVTYFALIPLLQGTIAGPETTVQGMVLTKTSGGGGGTVMLVDELNKNTVTLTIKDNQKFNNIQQFKRYSFTTRGGIVTDYKVV